jgi:hypothetical protein
VLLKSACVAVGASGGAPGKNVAGGAPGSVGMSGVPIPIPTDPGAVLVAGGGAPGAAE